jgi:hypothetical protein
MAIKVVEGSESEDLIIRFRMLGVNIKVFDLVEKGSVTDI